MRPRDDNARALAKAEAREKRLVLLTCLPALALIMVLVIGPALWLFWLSFQDAGGNFSTENYVRMVESSIYLKAFSNTVYVSISVTALCALIGYPLAYMIVNARPAVQGIALVCVLLPFWTSILVRTYAWMVILQRNGIANEALVALGAVEKPVQLMYNFTGTVIGMVHVMLPFLVFPLLASMRSVEPELLKAARNLGASPMRVFRDIFLPLTLPGLLAGLIIVFVLCFGYYVTPQLLGGGRVLMWAMQIEKNVTNFGNWGAASALGVVLVAVTFTMLWLVDRLFGLEKAMGGR